MTVSNGYFMLFGSEQYYPNGGAADLLFTAFDLATVKACIRPYDGEFDPEFPRWIITVEGKETTVSWFEIFDTHLVAVVAFGNRVHFDHVSYSDYAVPALVSPTVQIADKKTGVL